MSKLSSEEREALLSDLADMGGAGQAESESQELFCKRFLPVPEHLRAFAPDVALILGERGSGKSELFRAIIESGLLPELASHASGVRLPPPERMIWIKGYPLGADFPDARGLKAFLGGGKPTTSEVQDLWFAYLVRSLRLHLDEQASRDIEPLLSPRGGDLSAVMSAFTQAGQAPLLALDRLDEQLTREDRWVFVGYDELDTLGGTDWYVMGQAITGLIGFWAAYSRRWRKLRVKLFMRTDLFRRNSATMSADLPKLAANRAELSWSDRNLYALLVKRIANSSPRLEQYCRDARIVLKPADPVLGVLPEITRAEDAKPLVDRMVGLYMGANKNKGLAFNWLLDHIRDGQEKGYPRALVRLIEEAAITERNNPKATHSRLLHPTSLRRATEGVSKLQVTQAQAHEWPWIEGLHKRLTGQRVPMKRTQLEGLLKKDWEKSWSTQADVSPPAPDPRNLVRYLVEIGVLRERSQDRLDAPDLYQAGLGLRRKGGVARS